MKIVDNLIELRILINSACDGFSNDSLNKNISLSTKIKILFLLENKDLCPSDMTESLGVAKTNLANLLKKLIEENMVISYKNAENSKNVFYRISDEGKKVLSNYKSKLYDSIKNNYVLDEKITESLDNIIHFLKGDNK